jgi:outer membrane protein assembly factor BamD (BamD/ComL family)
MHGILRLVPPRKAGASAGPAAKESTRLKTGKFMKTQRSRALFLLCTMMLVVLSGCALFPKTPSPRPPARQHVDAKAQQKYYDLGVQQYSRENYGEAKEAFEQVLELGPNTALGSKAQENLKKIQRILKTLEEIEAK